MQKSVTSIVTDGKKVLLLKRGTTAPWMPNKYCFPGGKIEDEENIVTAGLRELKEETGISYPESTVEYIDVKFRSNYSKRVLLLKYQNLPEVKLNWEHSDYEWAYIQDVFERDDLVPSVKPALREFLMDDNLLPDVEPPWFSMPTEGEYSDDLEDGTPYDMGYKVDEAYDE